MYQYLSNTSRIFIGNHERARKMDGKIDEHGQLHIFRGNKLKVQPCKNEGPPGFACGDWCPLFSEPIRADGNHLVTSSDNDTFTEKGSVMVRICQQKTLIFENFIDERETT